MKSTIIIAEAGVNHNGVIENALKLVEEAAEAGADFVKFQTFKSEALVSRNAKKAQYQMSDVSSANDSQFEMLKKLELSKSDHEIILEHCEKNNIKFFSTAFDLESLTYLHEIGLDLVKIPSGEITNLPYLQKASKLFKKVIISTGMASLEEIRDALLIFLDAGISKKDITILHCNTEYPTPMSDVNLLAMLTIANEFGTSYGYSDHTLGIEIPIAAVALGATVIEKHFTLNKNMDGPDHKASLEPHQLRSMILAIRNTELAMSGSGLKLPSESELKNIDVARKSIVAAKDIKKGETFNALNITVKRPGNGISPMKWDFVLGSKAVRDFTEDELIEL